MTNREYLIEALEFIVSKLKESPEDCSTDDMQAVNDAVSSLLNVRGTLKDYANHYGKSENNVSALISRRYVPKTEKPKRRVTYRFGWISKIVPQSWKNR